MAYLEGAQLDFRTAVARKLLVGKWVKYLRSIDIDKTGRGMFFPRTDLVIGSGGRNLFLENGTSLWASDIVEMVEANV